MKQTQPFFRKIVVIGIGSLGSIIAKALVRAFDSNFILIDSQFLEPGNLVRHELPALSLESRKADALALLSKGLRADRKVESFSKDVIEHWPEALNHFKDADLILDFTGSRAVSEKLGDASELSNSIVGWGYVKPGPRSAVFALRKGSSSCGLQDAENALKQAAPTAWDQVEQADDIPNGLVWPEPGCQHPTFSAPFYRMRMVGDSFVSTLVSWLNAGATRSVATLYHQDESKAAFGVETRIVAQCSF